MRASRSSSPNALPFSARSAPTWSRSTRSQGGFSAAASASGRCSATGAGRRWRGRGFDPFEAEGGRDRFPVVSAASALELFHAAALVHDDIIDNSDTRRGRAVGAPAVRGAARRDRAGPAAAATSVAPSAILLGDLLLGWSDELLDEGLAPLPDRAGGPSGARRVRPDAHRGDRRPVPRHPRGARLVAQPDDEQRIARRARDRVQVGEVLRRVAARDRRRHRGRDGRRSSTRCADSACPSASPTSCATTCSASTATPRSPASRAATTSARASAPCSSRSRASASPPGSAACSTSSSATPTSTAEQVAHAAAHHRRLRRRRRGRAPHRRQRRHAPPRRSADAPFSRRRDSARARRAARRRSPAGRAEPAVRRAPGRRAAPRPCARRGAPRSGWCRGCPPRRAAIRAPRRR